MLSRSSRPYQFNFSDTVKTTQANDGVKMTFSVDAGAGAVGIELLAAPSAAQFTTAFTVNTDEIERRDYSQYAAGRIVFEMNAPSGYGAYAAADGIHVRIDHVTPDGAQVCDCDIFASASSAPKRSKPARAVKSYNELMKLMVGWESGGYDGFSRTSGRDWAKSIRRRARSGESKPSECEAVRIRGTAASSREFGTHINGQLSACIPIHRTIGFRRELLCNGNT